MAIIRSYDNKFEVIDYTQELMNIPNQWGLFQKLGIFGAGEGITTPTLAIEEINKSYGLIKDRVRGDRSAQNQDYTRKMHTFAVPHFPLDDAIFPRDIQGKIAYGGQAGNTVETLDAVRFRKMERIRISHSATLETARALLINTGDLYAPNGTVVDNFYTAFGISRKSVDFALGNGTTNVLAKCEEDIAHIQDNLLTGDIVDRIVGVVSPGFFNSLINHAKVVNAYQYYASESEPLRKRLGAQGAGLDARFRSFEFGGILFIEYRGQLADSGALITANEARFFPLGTMDTFGTYFAPAERFDLVNTVGQEAYMFETRDVKGTKIEIETESNFLNIVRRPAVVCRGY